MRTSRIARETARLANALSPRRTRSRNFDSPGKEVEHESTSDATLQKLQERLNTSQSPVLKGNSATPPSRKRKRALSTSHSPTVARITEESKTITATSLPLQDDASKQGRPKKAKRQPAKKVLGASGEVKMEPPANWEEVYQLTREMRDQWPAPVDTMGCESLAEEQRSPRDQRFQTLVALMLSSQTKDTVTSVAMKDLQEKLPGGLTLEAILAVEPATLNQLIGKVGFHNNKTKYIKSTAEILRDQYSSDIPETIEGLVSLPGVGPKMAYLCMSAAWGRDEGIGVDVHVHRITNLWGWHKTKEPEETRAVLESWLPRDKWHDINHLLVGFGQTYCPPVGRKCEQCKLASHGLCPSAVVGKNFKVQKVREKVVVGEKEGDAAVLEDIQAVEGQVTAIKAEDLDGNNEPASMGLVSDIEDLGQSRRRSGRASR